MGLGTFSWLCRTFMSVYDVCGVGVRGVVWWVTCRRYTSPARLIGVGMFTCIYFCACAQALTRMRFFQAGETLKTKLFESKR
ncbi:hypothetical protein CK620_03895 [Vandammella animalimorsus]|uniref:Uncharacterized protein n=1 Tax=Vandammella animalimorsus TaxID=2029117 RepID=A0A2A2ABF0_9BURK|nr:hypothetical protein CK620_03895 [Vandammella animalimorsus]